jgi:transposase
VIGSTRKLSVYAYGEPCDMRKSFNALSGLVKQELGRDFFSGDVFLFVGKDRKKAKALFWDGTGLCLYAKRLTKGRFASLWKRESGETPLELTVTELALFLEGSELVGRETLSPAPYRLGPVFQAQTELEVTS